MSGVTKPSASIEHGPNEAPFAAFIAEVLKHDGLRAAIDANYRVPETQCLPTLLMAATLPVSIKVKAQALARQLVEGLRARPAE